MSLEYLLIFSFSFLFSIIIVSRSSEHNRRRIMVVLRSIMMMIVWLMSLSSCIIIIWSPWKPPRQLFFFWLRQFSWLWILLTLWLLKVINFLGQTCWKIFFLHVSCHNKWWCQNVHQWGTRSLRSNNRYLKIRKYKEKPSKGGPVWSRPNTLRRLSQKNVLTTLEC